VADRGAVLAHGQRNQTDSLVIVMQQDACRFASVRRERNFLVTSKQIRDTFSDQVKILSSIAAMGAFTPCKRAALQIGRPKALDLQGSAAPNGPIRVSDTCRVTPASKYH